MLSAERTREVSLRRRFRSSFIRLAFVSRNADKTTPQVFSVVSNLPPYRRRHRCVIIPVWKLNYYAPPSTYTRGRESLY
jgi:hypothetical protein